MVVGDINVVGGEKVASENPASIAFMKMDVTKEEDWKAVVDQTASKFGQVDILVNNAGTTYRNKVSLRNMVYIYIYELRYVYTPLLLLFDDGN